MFNIKKTTTLFVLTFLISTHFIAFGFKSNLKEFKSNVYTTLTNEKPTVIKLKVSGMHCSQCSNAIHTALSKTEGIISSELKYPGTLAIVKYNSSKISDVEIIKVIEKAGFKAELSKK